MLIFEYSLQDLQIKRAIYVQIFMLLSAFLHLQDIIIHWNAEILLRNKIVLGNVRLAQTNDPEVAKGSVPEDETSPLQVPNTASKMVIAPQNQPRPFPPWTENYNEHMNDVRASPWGAVWIHPPDLESGGSGDEECHPGASLYLEIKTQPTKLPYGSKLLYSSLHG